MVDEGMCGWGLWPPARTCAGDGPARSNAVRQTRDRRAQSCQRLLDGGAVLNRRALGARRQRDGRHSEVSGGHVGHPDVSGVVDANERPVVVLVRVVCTSQAPSTAQPGLAIPGSAGSALTFEAAVLLAPHVIRRADLSKPPSPTCLRKLASGGSTRYEQALGSQTR